ncbi:Single-stranded DNA-binding protein [Caballeronia sordidicola]|uniref:Single-stranded DNA-binding protein n=1 Tax=Caballeronia sordidicola TaxID=196367 RepID=A0A158EZ50_CABSO|nr:single-stranded DNA-binding protein [Caballeronia sordidicola]SAL12050.1 Single-stranded DNA-binding protein [Caballeronia sordidicola]
MIDALVGGKLFKAAEERLSQAGKTFVTANIRAADGEGEGLFISVVAFSDSAKAALLALDEGDSVSLAGTLKIGTYEARDGSVKASVSMVAQNVMSAYQVSRKRKAAAEPETPEVHPGVKLAERLYGKRDAMNDPLDEPF